jgi:hypothetical protein
MTMDFYSRLLFQMDEALRYIGDGRLERLRLALLLLDNAAEMLMAEYIRHALVRERWSERLREQWLQISEAGEIPEAGKEALAFVPLTKKEKTNIDRNFEDKLNYLSIRDHVMPEHLVTPLLHLHQYRNEAYHRNHIRPDTIRMACLMLFEICCELTLILRPASLGYSTDGDYSWLQERFGWSRKNMLGSWREAVVEELRTSVIPTTDELTSVLSSYMDDRIEDFYRELDFLVENLNLDSRAAALTETIKFRKDSIQYAGNEVPKKPLEPRTIVWLEELRSKIPSIRRCAARVEAFHRFAELERELEPVEVALGEFTSEVDAHIQLQVDIARGK